MPQLLVAALRSREAHTAWPKAKTVPALSRILHLDAGGDVLDRDAGFG